MCFRPKGMSKPPLIFQGTGKRISKDEIAAYDNDVDVYWQPNAWINMIFSVQWIKNTLAAAVEGLDEYVLYCNNLTTQVSDDFMKEVRQNKGIVWFGAPNGTHFWQPVDAKKYSTGKVFKSQVTLALSKSKAFGSSLMKTLRSGYVMTSVNYLRRIDAF